MTVTRTLAVLVTSSFLLLAAACGGDDDSSPSPSPTTPASSGGGAAAPTATAEASSSPASSSGGGAASSGGDSIGSVTVGDETWMIVASVRCDFTAVPDSPLMVVAIAGHAEGDESIEITIDFDPRDTGLALILRSSGGDPAWMANNASFTVSVGATSIRGDGSFDSMSSPGTSEPGSFDARC